MAFLEWVANHAIWTGAWAVGSRQVVARVLVGVEEEETLGPRRRATTRKQNESRTPTTPGRRGDWWASPVRFRYPLGPPRAPAGFAGFRWVRGRAPLIGSSLPTKSSLFFLFLSCLALVWSGLVVVGVPAAALSRSPPPPSSPPVPFFMRQVSFMPFFGMSLLFYSSA